MKHVIRTSRRSGAIQLNRQFSVPAGETTAGNFHLLMGVNTPEVLRGEGETTGRELLQEPIPVRMGVKLQQITGVDQKAENFGFILRQTQHTPAHSKFISHEYNHRNHREHQAKSNRS